jgi:hypothetical protein
MSSFIPQTVVTHPSPAQIRLEVIVALLRVGYTPERIERIKIEAERLVDYVSRGSTG